LRTRGLIPWAFLLASNVSMAVLKSSSAVGSVGTRPASESSSFRLRSSASAHDRVPALRRCCLPAILQRKCLRQLHRLQNSSPAYLQPGEWRTKIVITGVIVGLGLLRTTVA